MKEIIHFAHGNGFPSASYNQILQELSENFDCYYINKIGHTEKYTVTDNWFNLVDELEQNILKVSPDRPVIGVGHSLGGVLNIMLAIKNPAIFKALVLLDSPLIGLFKSKALYVCKKIGLVDRVTPAFHSKSRKKLWQTYQEALSYLQTRPLFKNFSKECLHDYIDFAMEKDENGSLSLIFNPDIEYKIYRTIPDILYQYEGKLNVPTTLIYGKKSNIVKPIDVRYMKKKYNIASIETQGTHMFPFEYPKETATLIIKALDAIVI